MRIGRIIGAFLLGASTALPLEAQILSVVPQPRHIERLGGFFDFDPARTTIWLTAIPSAPDDPSGVWPVLEAIDNTSQKLFGQKPSRGARGESVVWGGVRGIDPGFDRICASKGVLPGDSLGEEGYTLLAEKGRLLVAALSARGLYYGLQTFNQLLRGSEGGRISGVRIIDRPGLRVRGIMDDISRGPVPTLEFFREQIRRLSEMKINTVSYYTEHMVLTASHPEFAPPEAALSIQQWRELSDYARKYHIELAGNFQSFGHFDKILSVPKYAHLGEGSLLSPALEESYSFLRDIFTEMAPAFNAPFFVTSCDETFDLGKGSSKKLVDSLGIGRVYVNHILRLRDFLEKLGKRMMIWGDVLLEHPEVIDLVPRDVVIGTWTYDSLSDFHRYILPFRSQGFTVFVTPGILNSFSVLPNFRQSKVNIERFVRDGIADGVAGAMTTVWDDGGTALFSRDWYGVAFAADRMWNCDTTDTTFSMRFDRAMYGDSAGGSSQGIEKLLELADLTPTDAMSERNLWSPVLPEAGKTLRLNVLDWDRVLAIAHEADSVMERGRPLLRERDLSALQFTANLYEASARLRFGVRDAAGLYARGVAKGASKVERRSALESVVKIIDPLRKEFSALKERYTALWLAENRPYALDTVEQLYQKRIEELEDVSGRVRSALADLGRGEALPPPEAIRLSVIESTGWYLRDWLITGPIAGNRPDTDYLSGAGCEADASPAVTQEFSWNGATYRWRRLSVAGPAEVDFRMEFPTATNSTVYAFATIESPEAGSVRALLGAGGDVRLFVNGSAVFDGRGSLAVDSDTLSLPLAKGKNRLLLKVCDSGAGAWGFSLRLPDSSVRNRKNRYRVVSLLKGNP